MLKNNKKRGLLLTTCVAATVISTGCRSTSGLNMFARRGEPSAEALAGSGPSTTYPTPPSASASPEAIASIAGGTAEPGRPAADSTTTQVAGFDVSPGTSAPPTNMAAAQANGVYAQNASFNPGASSASETMAAPFGSKAFTPKPSAPSTTTATGDSYAGMTKPSSPLTAPSTQYTAPPPAALGPAKSSLTPPSSATAMDASATNAGEEEEPIGFTLPPGVGPAMAAITPPGASTTEASGDDAASESVAPSYSTASANASLPPADAIGGNRSGGGYTPGSTGSASAYPTGADRPTTSGSFYR